ncbi:MAG: hypothetical protein H6564_12065 [Lewinellaceae bacterium]|nr:hypothetical protein [Lewinellaceae bacterium]
MYLYVELWKPRPEWDNLPCEQREEFLSMLRPNVERMKKLDAELVGFVLCDEDTPAATEYRYMAVWKLPNRGHVHMLEKAVRDEGWANYFHITNARGRVIPVGEVASDMVKV